MNRSLYIILFVISYSCSNDDPTSKSINNVFVSNMDNQSNVSKAQKAAQEASIAEESQQLAGQQASYQIMEQLANKAILAAKSADAAVAGKQIIVNEIENELHEVQQIEQKERTNLEHSRRFVNKAVQSAHESEAEVKLLIQAVQVAESNAANAVAAVIGAQQELHEKQELLNEVKDNREKLSKALNSAKVGMSNAKKSFETSACAAHNAMDDVKRNRRRNRKNARYISINT